MPGECDNCGEHTLECICNQNADESMDWTNIKDKRPQKGAEVLTWDGYYIFLENYDYELDGQYCFSQSGFGVTHWLNIPKPPSKDE